MKKLLITLLVLVIISSVTGIAIIHYKQNFAKQAITELKDKNTAETRRSPDNKSLEFPFLEIQKENTDFSGWLLIDETKIDLPIMKSNENAEFYLDHNFEKEPDKNGLPFLDERNNSDFSDEVTIIYGHNMQSGMIFHDLEQYRELSYFNAHKSILIHTQHGKKEYIAVAYIEQKIDNQNYFDYNFFTSFETEKEKENFLSTLLKHSMHTVEMPKEVGSLLILSTCDNITLDGRIALVAYEVTKDN